MMIGKFACCDYNQEAGQASSLACLARFILGTFSFLVARWLIYLFREILEILQKLH